MGCLIGYAATDTSQVKYVNLPPRLFRTSVHILLFFECGLPSITSQRRFKTKEEKRYIRGKKGKNKRSSRLAIYKIVGDQLSKYVRTGH